MTNKPSQNNATAAIASLNELAIVFLQVLELPDIDHIQPTNISRTALNRVGRPPQAIRQAVKKLSFGIALPGTANSIPVPK